MMKEPITVFIVDDSKVSRQLLTYLIEKDPDLKVIGSAENGEDALRQLKYISPDVITMDIVMPNINGFEVTRQIMETKPIPIIIISAVYNSTDVVQAFKAIEMGALAIFSKPIGAEGGEFNQQAQEIITTIKTVAKIKLIKRSPQKNGGALKKAADSNGNGAVAPSSERIEAVAIGASLGGPPAIATILSGLSTNFPVPIFIVQHISKGFTAGFVRWLQSRTALRVVLGEQHQKTLAGTVYVAPDACQMAVGRGHVIELDFSATTGFQPSVASLFNSMALSYGSHCVGVLLTGMGKDGAKELLTMKERGAFTIAQDEASSTMFGMPREAIALGAARQVVPLEQIANLLNSLARGM